MIKVTSKRLSETCDHYDDYRIVDWDTGLVTYYNPVVEFEINDTSHMNMRVFINGNEFNCDETIEFCNNIIEQIREVNVMNTEAVEAVFPQIKKVIFNDPATIVYWEDNTKTVVKCGEYDEFNPEFGLAMAISKKALGNTYDYYEVFKKWIPELDEEDSFDWLICNMDIVACGFNYKWNDAHDEVTINMYHDEVGDNIFIIAKDFAYKWDEENNKVVVSAYDIHRYKKIKQNQ